MIELSPMDTTFLIFIALVFFTYITDNYISYISRRDFLRYECKVAKIEAVREFAEKLKSKSEGIYPYFFVVDVDEIDKLVKEMAEESDE